MRPKLKKKPQKVAFLTLQDFDFNIKTNCHSYETCSQRFHLTEYGGTLSFMVMVHCNLETLIYIGIQPYPVGFRGVPKYITLNSMLIVCTGEASQVSVRKQTTLVTWLFPWPGFSKRPETSIFVKVPALETGSFCICRPKNIYSYYFSFTHTFLLGFRLRLIFVCLVTCSC